MRAVSLLDGDDLDAQERELKPIARDIVAMSHHLAELLGTGWVVLGKLR